MDATPRSTPKHWKDNDDPFDEIHSDFDPKSRVHNATQQPQDEEFDRQFYLAEDDEYLPNADTSTQNGRFIFESERTKAREAEMQKRKQTGGLRTARQSALDQDQQTWEENRLLSSGAAMRSNVDLEFGNEDDSRVQLLVHQIRPPFLSGKEASFSTVREAVPTVRDATSGTF
jgi:pre-mRNA-splicing factor ATP-dependent RNA helicase DHX38/PRP16